MKTLFPSQFNWKIFALVSIVIKLLFPQLGLLSYFALILSLHQFSLLFYSIGYIIPIRYLFGAFMSLQFFIGPVLAYNGLDQFQYKGYRMQISEFDYFSYAIPAVLFFIWGLHITAENFKGEIIDEKSIAIWVDRNPHVAYIFITLGFFSSILSSFFSSEISFVFYILGGFKFIGLFMVVFSNKKLKLGILVLVIGSIIASSLGNGMFHDLLTWIIFVGVIYAIKYKFGFNVKIAGFIIFILLAIVIQQLKGSYRAATSSGGEEAGLETLTETYEAQNGNDNAIFSFGSLAPSAVRINQGFIITNIIKTVPDRIPYSEGEEMEQILEAAVLPRIIAPNKLQAGDKTIFEKYSNLRLRSGTSMGLSSLGDAYLNFGNIGGCIFMFFLGLLYSTVLNYFDYRSKKQSVLLLFLPLLFYYPIRPDCELQTILGHLVKSTFIVLVMVHFYKNQFTDKIPDQSNSGGV